MLSRLFKRTGHLFGLILGFGLIISSVYAATTITIDAADYVNGSALIAPAGITIVAYPNGSPELAEAAYAVDSFNCFYRPETSLPSNEIAAKSNALKPAQGNPLVMVFGFDLPGYGLDDNWSSEEYTFEVRFSGTASFVSIDVDVDGLATLEAFDESNTVVDSDNGSYGTLSVSGADNIKVARVTMTSPGDVGCLNHLVVTHTPGEDNTPEDTIYLCDKPFSVYGMVQVNSPIIGYGQPGKDEIRMPDGSLMPVLRDYDGNGLDTYLIIDIQTYKEATWYGLFLGGCDPVYVEAEEVARLR